MTVDFIIVGQGISGTVIAQTIENSKLNYVIVDENVNSTSSKIAAGIMQPVSFKRCILTWRGKEFYDYSDSFYSKIIKKKGLSNSYNKIKLIRLFSSFEEQNNWIGKSNSEIYKPILGEQKKDIEGINSSFGNGEVKSASHLNVKEFLKDYKTYFEKNRRLINEKFEVQSLYKEKDLFHYKEIKAKNIIFCEGVNALKNNLLNYLPIIPNKGELIDIKTNYLPNIMLSKGVFSLPIKPNIYTIGSTYDHLDKLESTTEKGKKELLKRFNKISNNKFLLVNHKYGFRPTTIDRKPIIGEHPTIKNLFIFNGMGSKAVLMSPLLSKELIDFIVKKNKLDESVNSNRFFKKYSSTNEIFAKKINIL